MTWGWSHTEEAYIMAYRNLADKDREWLVIAAAEIMSTDDEGFHDEIYKQNLETINSWAGDAIVDYIWSWAQEDRTCDNGGWNAYMCPEGCHTVPFSREGCIYCDGTGNDPEGEHYEGSASSQCVMCKGTGI